MSARVRSCQPKEATSGSRPAGNPGGTLPEPGGWNRVQLRIGDLEEVVEWLRSEGASFRNELVIGKGGKQILLEDPSGNLIELFEPFES